jgi:hypothetical protein
MPCYTRLEIKLTLRFPADKVIAAVAKLQGWAIKGKAWAHQDGTRLIVTDDQKAVLYGPKAQSHVKPITTEIVRQHAARYGWKTQITAQGLRLTK